MALQAGKSGEMQIVLRVKDDGTAVIEKFGKTAEREGEKTSESWNKIGKSVGLVAAAAAATAAVMVKSAIDTADATGKAADKLGMTTESFSALAYAAKTTADITRDNFGQAMRMMVDNLSQAAQGTGLAKNAIADLGLNARQLAEMGPEKAILAISDALEKIPNQGDRVRIAMDVFRNSDMVNALRGGSEGLREMMSEAQRLNQVIGNDTTRQADAFNDNIDRLKASASGLAMTVASSLLPALNALLDRLNKAVGATNTLSVDLLQKDKEFLSVEFNAINKAAEQGFIVNTERAEFLRKQIEEIDAQIGEANKKAETRGAASATDGGSTSSPMQKAREATEKLKEELAKQLVAIHEATTSEEQLLGEKYVKDLQALDLALRLKLLSQEDYEAQRQAVIDTYEQQANEKHANELVRMAENLEALQESLYTEQELLTEAYMNKQLLLDDALMNNLLSEQTYYETLAALKTQYDNQMTLANAKKLSDREQQERMSSERNKAMWASGYRGQLDVLSGVLGQTANLMQSGSKKQFEIGKKAAIAATLINTYQSAMSAFNSLSGIPIVGTILGAVAAAAAIAFGMSQVAKIRSQQFQGGGAGGGSVPTFTANPNTGLPTGTPGGDVGLPSSQLPPPPTSQVQPQRVTNITLVSDSGLVSLEWLRTSFAPTFEQAQREGGIVVLSV